MNCCINCFVDQSLKHTITTLSRTNGNCDFCESNNVAIVSCESISSIFDQLFELYENHADASHSISASPFLIHEHISTYWENLFNLALLGQKEVKHLVNQIGRGGSLYNADLFEKPVEFEFLIDAAGMPAQDLQLRWENFSIEIKEKNRFFVNAVIDTDTLDSIFGRLAITYPAGSIFYRARPSESALPTGQLGKPPASIATPGRANPVGIPYLYLSDSEKTTLYETRIALHEGITIGKFVAIEPVSLVSLKDIKKFGPFEILDRGFTFEEFILYRPYLQRLGDELSKPVRKQDANLDYLPTQFLCEYIKSKLGFDAVEYRSAMNSSGYNLAVFNDQKLECVDANFYVVSDLQYTWS